MIGLAVSAARGLPGRLKQQVQFFLLHRIGPVYSCAPPCQDRFHGLHDRIASFFWHSCSDKSIIVVKGSARKDTGFTFRIFT